MKVLLENKFHYRRGGSETYYFAVADALREMGHEVAFFAMKDPRNEPCAQSRYFVGAKDYNGRTSFADKVAQATSLIYSRESKARFEELLEAERPDVVHLNLVHRQITFSILDAPGMAGVPVVYTAHDYIPVCPAATMLDGAGNVCDDCLGGRFSHCARKSCVKGSKAKSALAAAEAYWLRRHRVYDRIDRVIAPSRFMASKLVEGGFDPGRVVFMQNFVGAETATQASDAGDHTDRANPYLLFFGRLSREKGVGVLVDAFLTAADRMPGWRLVIAGDGPERAALEERLAGDPRGGLVELVGHRQGDDLSRLVGGASLAVASSVWRENMPYSVAEAFAAGTPVVASRIGGIPELVSEGETGFLCEPGDAGSLAGAILRGVGLCADGCAYRAMQDRCRTYVTEHCNRRAYARDLTVLYKRLVEEKKQGCCITSDQLEVSPVHEGRMCETEGEL